MTTIHHQEKEMFWFHSLRTGDWLKVRCHKCSKYGYIYTFKIIGASRSKYIGNDVQIGRKDMAEWNISLKEPIDVGNIFLFEKVHNQIVLRKSTKAEVIS